MPIHINAAGHNPRVLDMPEGYATGFLWEYSTFLSNEGFLCLLI